ncbi:flagellar protein FlaG [Limnobacter sp.]|uniref:flagellar protein FlaG n=1 Tax=Limnobacter sp. TaxID=2003368 RepID=UPI003513062E
MNISNLGDLASTTPKPQQTSGAAPAQAAKAVEPVLGNEASLSVGEVLEVVQKANAAMASNQSNLQFVVDPDNGRPIVKIVDKETQEVLKQIPSVEMLKIAKAIEKMQGVLISKEA